MKRIWNVLVVMLATNFVLAAGGVGWMARSGHLTRARLAEVRKVLFPPPPAVVRRRRGRQPPRRPTPSSSCGSLE